jgi:hypothetical protein
MNKRKVGPRKKRFLTMLSPHPGPDKFLTGWLVWWVGWLVGWLLLLGDTRRHFSFSRLDERYPDLTDTDV